MFVQIGAQRFDVSHRALVMGVVDRSVMSPDTSGALGTVDELLAAAHRISAEGADILDLGRATGPSGSAIGEEQEVDRLAGATTELRKRFGVPISVSTGRGAVADACLTEGADIVTDLGGPTGPSCLTQVASAHASVVLVHNVRPSGSDVTDGLTESAGEAVDTTTTVLAARAATARDIGIPPERIMFDGAIDHSPTSEGALERLRRSDELCSLGHPVVASVLGAPFVTEIAGAERDRCGEAQVSAQALAVTLGCRLVRADDVIGSRRTADTVAAILEAREQHRRAA